ncbi:uncharacterized protein HMPREF1541_07009 [Cyphellophora europaea CBS 101466]|uniref:Uncharacterized protein n=1 Tax=Cyphellophora europaea (strain CBS 101466) TaxID=1220924 RepID=W2RR94_CYPE1|nr:uncharacterized protein HMPREF1541_07009 [Cyphellophora europaea CBS 101466]ETN38967.1 hypothetical protein HMPREF1541_07009 [Cyphellophora europaea CBS 101466]
MAPPKTPPPSPALPPQSASHGPNSRNLPSHQTRTIDIELALAFPGLVHESDPQSDPQSGMAASTSAPHAQPSRRTSTSAHSNATDKAPTCSVLADTDREPSPQPPAQWRLCAALIAGLFQQSLSSGLIMTYGTILSY